MSRIRQLDPTVINKIAAGEVIERPASVVKELLENSIDALATRIEVDIEEGGSELIRVADNGCGIHPQDLLLSVTSHATSKIADDADLFRVHTMGFRGEALASISSVSRFTVKSRQEDSPAGVELTVEGGHPSQAGECGCPIGTIIEVRQLFFNTPVRRKFLKRTATEFGHISEQFVRIAIANPRLHMVLRHNGKMVYEQPASAGLAERLRLFYGDELSDQLIEVESETGEGDNLVRLWGFVAHPNYSKSTRKSQYLFLNGRWIQDGSLQHALREAYRGLLMVGRFPVCFLFLEMQPDQVDVNVHPTKMEVRFLLENLVGQVQHLIIGGGMANTFLAARGVDVGKSLCEHELTDTANAIMDKADHAGCTVHLPYDVVVSKEFAANPASLRTCNVHEVAADEMILDVGPLAVEALADVLKTCRTLVWNGPLGAFETVPFDEATVALARTAAALTSEGSLTSVAGGGDTVAALAHAGVKDDFSYVSAAGGAFLEWMEGKELPGVAALTA